MTVENHCTSTKLHEVWAHSGYGEIHTRPRIVWIKRAYKRACYRALRQGFAEYRGRYLLAADVPWRFKESSRRLPESRQELKTILTVPGICCMTWNASRALVYEELLHWASTQPLDVLAIQETGWRFTVTWSTSTWHCIHSADKQASILMLFRASIIAADRIAATVHIEGRFLHTSLFLDHAYDLLTIY